MAKYNKAEFLKYQELAKMLKLTSSFWRKQSEYIKKWIWADMRAGILQTAQKHHTYLSDEYKRLKANWMNPQKTGQKELFKKQSGKVSYKGTSYKGGSIVSNRTNTVDMMLTGQTIQGLHFVNSNALGGVMSYDAKDAGKIEGNRKYGREIATLREENRQKLIKNVSAALDVNIRQWAKEKVYINYGNK